MTGNSGTRIIQYYLPSTAPTTVGCYYECTDGIRWRSRELWEREQTGVQLGVKVGDRIYPTQVKR